MIFKQRDFKTFLWNGLRAENSVIASVALKKMALWTLKKRSTGDSCWLVYGRSA
jgi:hypothetical protein